MKIGFLHRRRYVQSSDFHLDLRRNSIRIETEPARLRPFDADLQVPDTAKFRAHTGWKPEISFEKTMQDLLDYWRERVNAGNVFLTR